MSGFIAGGIVAEGSTWQDEKRGTLVATATLALTVGGPADPRTRENHERLQRIGFKIGLLIEDGQRVEELLAAGVPGEARPDISADLLAVFGARPGQHWVGLAFRTAPPPDFLAPNVVRYALRLRLAGVRRLPQLVDAPSRYGNEYGFATSYLSALWILTAPKSKS